MLGSSRIPVRPPSPPRLAVGLALAVACLGLAATAPQTSAASRVCAGVHRTGALTFITSPDGQALTTYAVVPGESDRIFASDGRSLDRSLDGGCTWRTLATVTQLPGA